MASDLAAIRAEGRRLMAAMEAPADDDPDWIVATDAFGKWMYDHASDLLADPAPSVPVEQAGSGSTTAIRRPASSPTGPRTRSDLDA